MSNRIALDEKFHLNARDSSFVMGLLIEGEGEPFYAKWIKKRKSKGKKTLLEMLCVVGQFRLFIIKKKSSRKLEVMENLSISYEIEQVQVTRVNEDTEVVISSKSSKMSEKKGLEIELIDENGPNDLVQALVQAGRYTCYDFPHELPFKLSTESSDELPPAQPPRPAGNFVPAYLAACDYLQIDPFPNIDLYVHEMISGRILDLDKLSCGGDTLHSCDLLPVFLALKYNHFFTGVKLGYVPPNAPDFPSINLTSKLSVILTVNPTLDTVIWSNQNLRHKEISLLSNALIKNAHSSLKTLDLSDNSVFVSKAKGEDALMIFIHLIRAFPDTIRVLRFRNIGMGKNEAGLFFQTVQDKILPRITEFDLAKNPIGKTGISTFIKLLGGYSTPISLETLSLATCDIPAQKIMELLKKLQKCAPNLTSLDISGCSFEAAPPEVTEGICGSLGAMKTITTLKLNDCCATGTVISKILVSACKGRSSSVTIEIDGNSIGPSSFQDVADILPQCKNISSLSIARNNLGCVGMSTILKALDGFDELAYFDVSENINLKSLRERDRTQIMTDSLKVFSFSHPSLKTMKFRGSLKEELYAAASFIEAMSIIVSDSRFCVTTLDISENYGGENATAYFYAALESNDTLTSISADGNMCGMKGIQALRTLMTRNTVITSVKIPTDDIDTMVKGIKSKQEQRALMTTISTATQQIRSSINDNCRKKAKAARAKQKKAKLLLKKEVPESTKPSAEGEDKKIKKKKSSSRRTIKKEEKPKHDDVSFSSQSSSSSETGSESSEQGEGSFAGDRRSISSIITNASVNSDPPPTTITEEPKTEDDDDDDDENSPPVPPRPAVKQRPVVRVKSLTCTSLAKAGSESLTPIAKQARPMSVMPSSLTPPPKIQTKTLLKTQTKVQPKIQPKMQTKVQHKEVPVMPKPQPQSLISPRQSTPAAHLSSPPSHVPAAPLSPKQTIRDANANNFRKMQPRQPQQAGSQGQFIGVRTAKKANIGIVVAPSSCSSAPIPSRPAVPPRAPNRGSPVLQRPPQLVPPPSPTMKRGRPPMGSPLGPTAKAMPMRPVKKVEEVEEVKEVDEIEEKIIEENNEVEEEEVDEEEEEEENSEEINDDESVEDEDDEEEFNEFAMKMGMGFDGFDSNSGDAFHADGGMNFFRDRKISRKSMMYKDTWWTTLRPAKMESMPITSLLPEDNDNSINAGNSGSPAEDVEGNDEAIPGFDENITAVPSMATEINGDDDDFSSSSLPLI